MGRLEGADNKNGGNSLMAAREDYRVTEELIGATAEGGNGQPGPPDLNGAPADQAWTPTAARTNQQQPQQGESAPSGGNVAGWQLTQGNQGDT